MASTLAQTNHRFETRTGLIDYADIEINLGAKRFSVTDDDAIVGIDLQAVMAHEVGHYIGLDHSDEPASVMRESHLDAARRLRRGNCSRLDATSRASAPMRSTRSCDPSDRG